VTDLVSTTVDARALVERTTAAQQFPVRLGPPAVVRIASLFAANRKATPDVEPGAASGEGTTDANVAA
jgi:hypothetical protein